MTAFEAVEVVRVRPKDGAAERLLEIRPGLMAEYAARYGDRVSAELVLCEDGSWVDIWRWATRELAESALATAPEGLFAEWVGLVEMVSFEWATPAGV